MPAEKKIFVSALVRYEPDGYIAPIEIQWEDGRRFEIDRVIDVRPAASLKAGGAGIRYTCRILGQERYLFLENGRWFVEGKEP